MNRNLRFGAALAFAAWSIAALVLADSFHERGDLLRQWKAAKYLRVGANPYGLTLDILKGLYGSALPPGFNLWSLPPSAAEKAGVALPDGLEATEATYPPFASALFAATIGQVGDPRLLTALWSLAGILCTLFIARHYGREENPPALLMAALFAPFLLAVHHGQFSTVVLACLLYAWREDTPALPGGLALAVAMIKPSVMLPFAVLFLDGRRLPRLVIAGAAVALATLWASHASGGGLIEMHREWLAVAEYFNLNKHWTSWPGTPHVVKFAVLALCCLAVAAISRIKGLPREFAFAAAGVFSMHYAYHSLYDYVMLFPYFCVMTGSRGGEAMPSGRAWRLGAVWIPFGGVTLAALLQLAMLSRLRWLDPILNAASGPIWRFCTISGMLVTMACVLVAATKIRANRSLVTEAKEAA